MAIWAVGHSSARGIRCRCGGLGRGRKVSSSAHCHAVGAGADGDCGDDFVGFRVDDCEGARGLFRDVNRLVCDLDVARVGAGRAYGNGRRDPVVAGIDHGYLARAENGGVDRFAVWADRHVEGPFADTGTAVALRVRVPTASTRAATSSAM